MGRIIYSNHVRLENIRRVAVIGNACSGKTTLTRVLSKQLSLPAYHIDRIQYDHRLQIRPHPETISEILNIQISDKWIIDGYGPLDILQDRLRAADCIVMLDLPIQWNYLFACKRILTLLWKKKRLELPEGSSERNLFHLYRLFKSIHQTETKMRPEMLRILKRSGLAEKTIIVRNRQSLNVESDIFSTLRPVGR